MEEGLGNELAQPHSRAAGLRWLTDDIMEALRLDFNAWARGPRSMLPEGWRKGYGAFLPKKTPYIRLHRPIVPPVPTVGVAMRALLIEHGPKLQPMWLNAEGLVAGGGAVGRSSQSARRSGASHFGF